MLQPVVEPIVLGLETDKHACRLAVARDDDLLTLRKSQVSGQIVLDLRERHLTHRFRRGRRAK